MTIRRVFLAALLSAASFIGGYAKIGVQHQTVLGNPSNATTDTSNSSNYLLARDQYTISYNDARGVANWVSWNLTSDDIGDSGRSRDFFVDPDLPPAFSVVLTTDYQGSGYDRGHMCPSADRTVSRADNNVTFYMSNMVPQTPDNNQGVWATFETYCRSLANAGNEVLIVSGPSLFGGSKVPSGAADIPGYVWKLVVVVPLDPSDPDRPAVDRITPDTRVIAIKIPNIAGVRSDPWENYLVPPSVIEADTGFNLFRNLSPLLAGILRNKIDGQTTAGLPVITTQPVFQAPALGGTATFTVAAVSETPLNYQWFKDNDDIVGATAPTLTISGVTLSDAGSYYAVVSNAVGSSTSTTAALVISGLPPTITSDPAAPATSPAGSTITLSVGVAGSPPFNYQWLFNGAPIEGANGGALVLANVQDGHTGAYEVMVGNGVETVMSAAANVFVTPASPTFVTHPAATSASIGGTATLTALATGTDPISYVWTLDGHPVVDSATVSGATTGTLTLTNLDSAAAGSYRAIATNVVDSSTSNGALLTVNAATIFWNFDTATPTSGLPADVTDGELRRGNNNGTTNDLLNGSSASSAAFSGGNNAGLAARTDLQAGGAFNPGANGSGYFEFTLRPEADRKIIITGINFGARSTGTGPKAYTILTSLDGFTTPLATGTLLSDSAWRAVTAAMAPITSLTGDPLTVRIYGHGGTGGATTNTTNWRIDGLKVTVTTLVSTGAVAPTVVAVTPETGSAGVAVNTPVTVTFDQPVTISNGWFSISSLLNGPLSATITGGPTTFTISPPANFAFGDVITTTIHGSAVKEKDTNTLPMAGNVSWSFATAVPVVPGIVANPESLTVADGGTASFTVVASGTAPLSYQWRRNGAAILTNPTATSAVLVMSPVGPADAGNYSVVVTNPAGSATSAAAALAVSLVAPTITTPPSSQLVTLGGTASFSVSATGSAILSYEWRRNGMPLANSAKISGVNTPHLAISDVTAGDVGSYSVFVSNAAGDTSSVPVELGVTTASLGSARWTFGTAAPGVPGPTTALPAFVTGGVVTHGNNNGSTTLLTTTSASSSYSSASASFNAGAAARLDSQVGGSLNRNNGGSAYFEFTLTPTNGRQAVVTGISFGSRSTGTGPRAYTVYSSADGFASPIATGALLSDSVWRFITTNLSAVRSLPDTDLTIRIYGHGGQGNTPGSGTANWRIDDLNITLGVELPPAVQTTLPAAGATGVLRDTPITVAFNQAVVLSGNPFRIESAASGEVPFNVSGGPEEFTLTPTLPFAYGDSISITVDAAKVRDDSGTLTMMSSHAVSFATELAVPPGFAEQPESRTITAFDDTGFSVTVSGTGPFTYQWRRNGEPITDNPSASTATLQLSHVPVSAAGEYDCEVTGYAGSATSAKATLTVEKAAATVTLGTMTFVYDGSPKPIAATTAPADLDLTVTYDGSPAAPSLAGEYAVIATVQDENYAGSASGTLRIQAAAATVTLGSLMQRYDGGPKAVSSTTQPEGLNVLITYNGASTPPTLPGDYDVEATIEDPNYRGASTATLVIEITALVRRAPAISGGLDGSVQLLSGDDVSLSGGAWLSGDLLVPGMPELLRSGNGKLLAVQDGTGAETPSNYSVHLSGNALLRHLVRRVDAITLPVVSASPGSEPVTVHPGSLRTLAGGSYGAVSVTGRLVLGNANSSETVHYQFQTLTMSGAGRIDVVGPVIVTLPNGVSLNGVAGDEGQADWLTLQLQNGGLSLSGNASFAGNVIAPNGAVKVSGNATLAGSVVADRLTISGNGLLTDPP